MDSFVLHAMIACSSMDEDNADTVGHGSGFSTLDIVDGVWRERMIDLKGGCGRIKCSVAKGTTGGFVC
jgi:hypothetical protein